MSFGFGKIRDDGGLGNAKATAQLSNGEGYSTSLNYDAIGGTDSVTSDAKIAGTSLDFGLSTPTKTKIGASVTKTTMKPATNLIWNPEKGIVEYVAPNKGK